MFSNTPSKSRSRWAGIFTLAAIALAPAAFAQDRIEAKVPFSFHVANKTLPAGTYQFRIDRQNEIVNIEGSPKVSLDEIFLTTLATPPHSNANDIDIVFDKVGSNYTLSEIWEPGGAGILLHATKGPHEHNILHIRRS